MVMIGKNLCTQKHIHSIQQQCLHLICAYQNAVENMPQMTWLDCCVSANNELSKYGYQIEPRRIQHWNIQFCTTGHFPNPCFNEELDPPIFNLYPEIKKRFLKFCHDNLADMSNELVHKYVCNTLLPNYANQHNHHPATTNVTDQEVTPTFRRRGANVLGSEILQSYITKPPSLSTVAQWIKICKFSYCPEKKSYYVDGHEKPEQRFHRYEHTKKYLTELELLTSHCV